MPKPKRPPKPGRDRSQRIACPDCGEIYDPVHSVHAPDVACAVNLARARMATEGWVPLPPGWLNTYWGVPLPARIDLIGVVNFRTRSGSYIPAAIWSAMTDPNRSLKQRIADVEALVVSAKDKQVP